MFSSTRSTSVSSETNPYSLDVGNIWLNAYDNRTKCDVKIKCGAEEFPAHSLWLTFTIPYFNTAVATGVGARPTEAADPFDLRDSPISADAMKLVLDMVYGRWTPITADNCVAVHQAANYLGLEKLAGSCVEEMIDSLSVGNVVAFIMYARRAFKGSRDVFRASQDFLTNDVDALVSQGSFVALDLGCLVEICRFECCYELMDMYACLQLVLCWILEPHERCKSLADLLRCMLISDIDFSKMCLSEPYRRFMASHQIECQSKILLSKMVEHPCEARLDKLLGSRRCRDDAACSEVLLFSSRANPNRQFDLLTLSRDCTSWEPASLPVDAFPDVEKYEVMTMSGCRPKSVAPYLVWLKKPEHNVLARLYSPDDEASSWSLKTLDMPDSLRKNLCTQSVRHGLKVAYGKIHVWYVVCDTKALEYSIHYAMFDPCGGLKYRPYSPVSYSIYEIEPFHPSAQFYAYGDQVWSSSELKPLHLVLNRGIANPEPALLKPLFPHLLPGVTTDRRKLYVAGGAEGQRRVEFFDPEPAAWFELPSLPRSHENIHLATVRNKLFMIAKVGQTKKVDWLDLNAVSTGWHSGPDVPLDFASNAGEDFLVIGN